MSRAKKLNDLFEKVLKKQEGSLNDVGEITKNPLIKKPKKDDDEDGDNDADKFKKEKKD